MDGSINFYILNRKNKVVSVLSTEEVGEHIPVLSATVEEKLSSYDILTLSIPADAEGSELLKEEYTIIFEDIKGWREYIITEIEDTDGDNVIKTVTAELSSVELLDDIVETELKGRKDPEDILRTILSGTRWNVGNVDTSIYNSSFNEMTQYKSVLEVIDLISSSFKCEVAFSYTVGQNNVANRFVHLYKQIGSDKGKRFEVDKDVTEITRTIDTTALKTAIIPFGAEPSEATEGEEQAKRLDIKNVVWSKAKGDPADKPKGQSWIGDPQALANWGKAQEDGSLKHRFIALEINVDTEAELAAMAWVNLGKYTEPKVTYEAKVIDLYRTTGDEDLKHEHVFLGDTVAVLDNYFADPLLVKSRVIELVRDLLDPLNNEIVLGTAKQSFRVSDVEREVEDLATLVAKANYTASNAVINGSGSTTFSGSATPLKPVKGDSWFRPHPTKPGESQLVIYNGTTWEVAADTAELEAVKEEMQGALLSIETAKQSADSAVTKAEQAIKDAGFAQTDAGTAKRNAATALTTAQTAISNSGTALTSAEKALKAYEELDIGTQNLVLNSEEPKSSNIYLVAEYKMSEEWVVGQEYTVTIRGQVNEGNFFRVWYDDGYSAFRQSVYDEKRDLWVITGVVTELARPTKDTLRIYNVQSTTAKSAEVEWIQVVKGNKVLNGWTPAPEDVQVQITDINGELSRKVAQTTFDTLNGTVSNHSTLISQSQTAIAAKAEKTLVDTINQTVAKHTTDIKATADGLAAKAEKTLVDSLNKTVTSQTNEISANAQAISTKLTETQVNNLLNGKNFVNQTTLDATANGLSASITQVSSDLEGLEIGGRNLMRYSDDIFTRASGATNINFAGQNIPELVIGDEYTFSVDLKADIDTKLSQPIFINSSNRPTENAGSTVSKEWKKFVFHFKWAGGSYNGNDVHVHIYFNSIAGNFYARHPKLERGTKATDWTPAPEDMATVEQFTTIDATVKGLQTTVGNKADKTQVTQLANQWTQTTALANGHTGQISNLGEQINLRATKGEITEAILADKSIKDTRDVNNSPLWYYANYPKQTVEEFKRSATMGITGTTYGQLTTKVLWSDSSGGAITQTFSSADGVFKRISINSGAAWGAWEKVADANKLMSQLNINPEGILLQGKNIQLDGNVTMQDAFISKIKAIDITADRIKGGTINGSNVNVINLNANNITAGILKGTNLSLNLTTGEVLFQKGIIKRSDNKFGMDITAGRFESYSSMGGITIEDGSLKLYKTPVFIDPVSKETYYGSIDYVYEFFGGQGISVEGTNGAMLRSKGYLPSFMGRATGAGVTVSGKKAILESEEQATISGGALMNNHSLWGQPRIVVGSSYKDETVVGPDIHLNAGGYGFEVSSNNSGYSMNFLGNGSLSLKTALGSDYFMVNYKMGKYGTTEAEFELGGDSFQQYYDSAGRYIRSVTIYNRTTSAASNMYCSSNGTLARSTSASKYKLNISEIPNIEDYSAKILEIKPKQWFDKSAVENYAEEIEHKNKGRVDDAPITPFYGLIAEDLVEAGLEKYVQYGSDGKEVEGIMYDRLWTLLIPIVKQQKEDIEELKTKLREMENVI